MTEAITIIPRHSIVAAANAGTLLVNEFLKEAEHRGISKSTRVRYSFVCREFFLHASNLRPDQIRPSDIRDYLAWLLKRGYSNYSLHQTLCALRSMFRFAEAFEIVRVSPARSIQTRRYHRKLPKVLSEDEINRLIDSAENIRDKALLTFMYATGCRVAEVAGVRLSDISWASRTVLITGKGDKQRLVPLHAKAVRVLQEYLGSRTDGWLFQGHGMRDQKFGQVVVNKRPDGKAYYRGVWRINHRIDESGVLRWEQESKVLGNISELTRAEAKQRLAEHIRSLSLPRRPRPVQQQPMTTVAIRLAVRRTALKAGLRVHPHMFRHSFATHLLDHGADIITIGSFLGHAQLSTTQIYAHVSQKKMLDTLEKFHPHWRSHAENKD